MAAPGAFFLDPWGTPPLGEEHCSVPFLNKEKQEGSRTQKPVPRGLYLSLEILFAFPNPLPAS